MNPKMMLRWLLELTVGQNSETINQWLSILRVPSFNADCFALYVANSGQRSAKLLALAAATAQLCLVGTHLASLVQNSLV